MLPCLAPVLFTFKIQSMLKFWKGGRAESVKIHKPNIQTLPSPRMLLLHVDSPCFYTYQQFDSNTTIALMSFHKTYNIILTTDSCCTVVQLRIQNANLSEHSTVAIIRFTQPLNIRSHYVILRHSGSEVSLLCCVLPVWNLSAVTLRIVWFSYCSRFLMQTVVTVSTTVHITGSEWRQKFGMRQKELIDSLKHHTDVVTGTSVTILQVLFTCLLKMLNAC
jgi:hypothetical protein